MATPKIIADFETQLSTALSVGGTSFTLSSATDDDGTALPAGLYYFTIDNGTSNKEFVAGTLSGSSVTGVLSVSRQGTETSGVARAHRVGAPIIITDFLTYKKYMDEIALVSAPDADTNTKGVVEAATLAEVRAGTASGGSGAVLVPTPDVLDDLPTQDEKAALAAGGDFGTASTSNKFVTEDFLSAKNAEVVPFTGSGTWTKDSGLKYITVELVGGGGAGGAGSTSNEAGGSGGGGGYSRKTIQASALGSTETVTIGAAGGTTSFGSHCQATGGSAGEAYNAGADGGAGGVGSSGDININGQGGGAGCATGSTTGSGPGGNSFFGGGARGVSAEAGAAGTAYGGGGSGGHDNASGGAGAAGYCVVTEYYS